MYSVCATHNMLLQKKLRSSNYLISLSKIPEHLYGPFQMATGQRFFAILLTIHECMYKACYSHFECFSSSKGLNVATVNQHNLLSYNVTQPCIKICLICVSVV